VPNAKPPRTFPVWITLRAFVMTPSWTRLIIPSLNISVWIPRSRWFVSLRKTASGIEPMPVTLHSAPLSHYKCTTVTMHSVPVSQYTEHHCHITSVPLSHYTEHQCHNTQCTTVTSHSTPVSHYTVHHCHNTQCTTVTLHRAPLSQYTGKR